MLFYFYYNKYSRYGSTRNAWQYFVNAEDQTWGISQHVQGQGWRKGQAGTSWNSARRNAKCCNPLPWQRAGRRTSFMPGWGENKFHTSQPWAIAAKKGSSIFGWYGDAAKQLFLSTQPLSRFAPQIQVRHWSSGAMGVSRGPPGWLWGEAFALGLQGQGLLSLDKRHQTPEPTKGSTEETPGSPQCCTPAGWATTDTDWN